MEKQVLITVVHPNTAMQTLEIIKEIDHDAFTFMTSVTEVHGKGFAHYRADLSKWQRFFDVSPTVPAKRHRYVFRPKIKNRKKEERIS